MSLHAEKPKPRSGAHHELVDHPSEVTLRLRAPTLATLIAEATSAFGELVPPSTRSGAPSGWREFRVGGADRTASLVRWLNEMVYLCEIDQWLPVEVDVAAADGAGLRIRARGVALETPFVLVKAATMHNATVRDTSYGLEGEVTLDI